MVAHRTLLASASIVATLAALGITPEALAADRVKLGDVAPSSFDVLIERTHAIAGKPYAPPATAPTDILFKIDYEAHGKVKFDITHALFTDDPGQFPVTFFYLGASFRAPMRMHVMEKDTARKIVHDESYFGVPADSLARKLPCDSNFAGFHFQGSRLGNQKKLDWKRNDRVAFLGASYFRAIGGLHQYGLSARGITLDVARADESEEPPNFTHVWFGAPADNRANSVTIYMLLDGPNITDACRFVMHRTEGVVMGIGTAILLRKGVDHFGITLATSIYWFSKTTKDTTTNQRSEVHDSDGLALWTGNSKCIWRSLDDPPRTMASAFGDNSPRGFGLLQRDRSFNNHQNGVHYERRPSLWVGPLEGWDEGAVQLIEIPTDDEIHDNIVTMWVPKTPARVGNRYRLCYHPHWLADEPYPTQPARCVATRMGNGGQPGQPRPHGVRKFVVEFRGGPLKKLPFGTKPEIVLSSSRSTFSYVFTEAVPNDVPRHWRTQFGLTVDGKEPVDVWLFLRVDSKPLSETWLYQCHPFQSPVGPVAS